MTTSKAVKNSVPFTLVSWEGSEPMPPGIISFTSMVPIAVPPIRLLSEPSILIPSTVLPRSAVPVASVPIKFPSITLPSPVWSRIPLALNRLMMSPRTVLPPPIIVSPLTAAPAPAPFNSMSGVAVNPGCVVPSMMTASRIVGSPPTPGAMVCTPAPEMLKLMASRPAELFASIIA